MSKTVDERVVSMQFDNKHFEANAKTTLSTLDKLKQSLNFKGAADSLTDVSAAANKVNFSGLSSGVEAVRVKFDALQVFALTCLTRISNAAIDAGTKIAKSLTIEPITTGFNEYELKMNSVQTIMASTGESLETVNGYLEELNRYSDQTIYSFSDMTQNIGKFTNAGVKLDKAVLAIKGVSNVAALSGANANEASRAMYNFAQALSAGYVKLIDWKSIENANMATVGFKEQLIESAVAVGTLTKTTDGMYKTLEGTVISATKNFNESLQDQWMTTEVLIGTLSKYADETTEIGAKATQAATEVKTFTQLMDTLKESAQSGWAQTWEIIFGDFEEGKSLWTSISNVVGGLIDKMNDVRNTFLKTNLTSSWEKLSDKITAAGLSTEDFGEKVREAAKASGIDIDKLEKSYGSLRKVIEAGLIPVETLKNAFKAFMGAEEEVVTTTEELEKVAKRVLKGEFGNGEERIKKLTEAGYDWAEVQNTVSKLLGSSKRHVSNLTSAEKKNLSTLTKLTDEQLKNKGYTEDQIEALRELQQAAEETGTPIEELIESMSTPSGRELLIEAFANVLKHISKIVGVVKEAWDEFFPELESSDSLYNLIDKFKTWTDTLSVTDETLENLKNTIRGFFSAISFTSTVSLQLFDSIINIIDRVVKAATKNSDFGILAATGKIGEAIVKFTTWLTRNTTLVNAITTILNRLADGIIAIITFVQETVGGLMPSSEELANVMINIFTIIEKVVSGISRVVSAFTKIVPVQNIVSTISSTFSTFGDALGGFTEFFNKLKSNDISSILESITKFFDKIETWVKNLENSEDFITDFVTGIGTGIKSAFAYVLNVIGATIHNMFKAIGIILGKDAAWVESGFYEAAGNIIDGILLGLNNGIGAVVDAIGNIAIRMLKAFCALLGICSPSTVFFEQGENVIAGLINGLTSGTGGVVEAIKNIATSLFEAFGNIDFAALFVGGSVIFMGSLLKRLVEVFSNFFEKLAEPLVSWKVVIKQIGNTITSGLTNVFNSIVKVFDAKALETKSVALWNFAKAVALLAAVLVVLTFVDVEKLKTAGWTLAILAGGLLAIMAIASKLGGSFEFVALSALIIGISTGLLLLAVALKLIGDMDVTNGLATITMLTILIAGLIFIFRFVGDKGKYIKDAGKTIKKMAWAILIIAVAMKLLATIEPGDIAKGIITIASITALFAGLILIFRWVGNNGKYIKDAGKTIKKMSNAILIIAIAMKLIATMTWGDVAKGIVVIGGIGLLFAGFVAVSQYAGKHANDAGKMLKKMAWAIAILAIAIKLIASMTWAEIDKGIQTIAGIEILFLAFIGITKLIKDQDVNTATTSFMKMTGAILILSLAMKVFSTMSAGDIFKGIITVAALELLFAAVIHLTKGGAGKDVSKAGNMLMKMAVAILILSAAIAVISVLDPTRVAVATVAISALMLTFAAVIASTKNSQDATANIMKMAIAIGVMGVAIAILAALEPARIAAAGGALAAVMAAFALMTKTVSGFTSPKALLGLVAMLVVVGLLAGILWLLQDLPADRALGVAGSLSLLLLSMSGALLILAAVGPVAGAALAGIMALGVLIAGVGAVITILAGLNKWSPDLQEFLDGGIKILEKIGYALGSFVGNIVGGFAAGALSGLPQIGTHLSDFMDEASGFIAGAKDIKAGELDGVKELAEAILYLTGVDIFSKLSTIFTGNTTFVGFATKLAPLGEGIKAFSDAITADGGIDAAAIEAAATAGKLLAELQGSLVGMGGVIEFFRGRKDLGDFGLQLVAFGKAIRMFSRTVSVDGGINSEAIEAAATAGKTMAELQATLPGTGGVIEFFTGKKDLATFSSQLATFGDAIKDFSDKVTGIDIAAVEAAANAGSIMAELQRSLPGTGGIVQWFCGEKNFATFGTGIVAFGKAIRMFSKTLSIDGGINEAAIEAAANAGSIMAELQSSLPATGGVINLITGKKDLATFGANLKTYGEALVSFSKTVSAEGAIDPNAIQAAHDAGKIMTELQAAIPEDKWLDGKISLDDFGGKLKSFGESMTKYSENLKGFDSARASSATYTIKQLISILSSLGTLDSTVATSFKDSIDTLAETNITGFVNAFDVSIPDMHNIGARLIEAIAAGATATQAVLDTSIRGMITALLLTLADNTTKFKTVGTTYVEHIAKGILMSLSPVTGATKMVVDSALSSARGYYDSFSSAGSYVVDGFAAGITANTWKAEAKAKAMAAAALQAAKEALGVASPSKEFYALGRFSGLGFTNALSDFATKAYSAGAGMADSAMTGLGDTLSKINNIVNSDMDMTPTIRPVLDMSEIQNGANQINGLFSNRTYALAGINAQLDSAKIDRMGDVVNQLQQLNDSDNSDIVSAITTLRSDVNALGQAISSMQLTLDGGAVVGGLITRIDNGLGQIAGHKGRGN